MADADPHGGRRARDPGAGRARAQSQPREGARRAPARWCSSSTTAGPRRRTGRARTSMVERLIAEAEGQSRPVLIVPTAIAAKAHRPQGRGAEPRPARRPPPCSRSRSRPTAWRRRRRIADALQRRRRCHASSGWPTASTTTARRAPSPTGSRSSRRQARPSSRRGPARRRSARVAGVASGGRLEAQVLRAEGGPRSRHAARHVGARPAPGRGALRARRRRDARARQLRPAARAQQPGDARRDRRRALGGRRAPARRALAMAPRRPRLGRARASRRSRCWRRSTTSSARCCRSPRSPRARTPTSPTAIDGLIKRNVSVLMLADIGTLPRRHQGAAWSSG